MKVKQLSLADYNQIENIPVINQDLSASGFTPTANTYYRHTGTTGTYTQGVIYYYDGTEYKALDGSGGSGGISDVQVNGTSVVTDGVANIPQASVFTEGVVRDFYKYGRSKKQSVIYCGRQTGNSINILPSEWDSGLVISSKTNEGVNDNYDFAILVNGSYGNMIYSSYQNLPLHFYVSPQNNATINNVPHLAIFQNALRNYKNNSTFYSVSLPDYNGKMMCAPVSWSSGTSGSVTLSEAGTYQIYSNDGKNNFNYGLVYFDGTSDTYAQSVHYVGDEFKYCGIVGGVITIEIITLGANYATSTETDTVYYRRVGK